MCNKSMIIIGTRAQGVSLPIMQLFAVINLNQLNNNNRCMCTGLRLIDI